MRSNESNIGLIRGPGSFEVPVRVHLGDLREQLIKAQHPLATVPQWNGQKMFLVHAKTPDSAGSFLFITAKSKEEAEGVALANVKTRSQPDWSVEAEEVTFTAGKQLHHTVSCEL